MQRNTIFGLLTAVLVLAVCGGILSLYFLFGTSSGGRNLDMTIVQSDLTAVPFYELVFPEPGVAPDELFLPDPIVKHRPAPFHRRGHDVLGFRNLSVPTRPDVVTIGDSQTYGVNAGPRSNWPHYLGAELGATVYNMSFGGWGGLHYSYIAGKAIAFRPHLIVVALYMGNDSFENVFLANTSEYWREHRSPHYEELAREVEQEVGDSVRLAEVPAGDSRGMTFTPKLRLRVNDTTREYARVGYRLQALAVSKICSIGRENEIPVALTIIPTKEYVYWPYLEGHEIDPGDAYRELIRYESANLQSLVGAIEETGCPYVDVVGPLQQAAAPGVLLYPDDENGHPMPEGYRIIGEAVARGVADLLRGRNQKR